MLLQLHSCQPHIIQAVLRFSTFSRDVQNNKPPLALFQVLNISSHVPPGPETLLSSDGAANSDVSLGTDPQTSKEEFKPRPQRLKLELLTQKVCVCVLVLTPLLESVQVNKNRENMKLASKE